MSFSSVEALREAGVIGGTMQPALEEFYATLTEDEVQVLVSTKKRLDAILPDVEGHSQDWTSPESTQEGFDAAMLCACGIWSGSGAVAK
jgi:hypothetical protein